jgi:hypothetical protein
MSSIYRIPTQQTYKGKTASGWLRGAELAEMQSGDIQVVSPALPGCLLHLTDDGRMVVEYFNSAVVALRCSRRARDKLAALTRKADAQMRRMNLY